MLKSSLVLFASLALLAANSEAAQSMTGYANRNLEGDSLLLEESSNNLGDVFGNRFSSIFVTSGIWAVYDRVNFNALEVNVSQCQISLLSKHINLFNCLSVSVGSGLSFMG